MSDNIYEYVKTTDLDVGYGKKIIIEDINLKLEAGKIMTLIGANGSGKSTILKTITRELEQLKGCVYIDNRDVKQIAGNELAQKMATVMTKQLQTEYVTCREVVEAGRYPYTGHLGLLTDDDTKVVDEALEMVQGMEIAEQNFMEISDGQRQRILLARAICQQTKLIVLDEPTSYLDIHYKLELLDILKRLVKEKQISVLMSMHELELAGKFSDYLVCVSQNQIKKIGKPSEILKKEFIMELFGLDENGFYLAFENHALINGEQNNSARYFKNTACQYYPCHTGMESDAFNCLFCYCPMNQYEDCLGTTHYIDKKDGKRIKDCSKCTFPHEPQHYDLIMDFLRNH